MNPVALQVAINGVDIDPLDQVRDLRQVLDLQRGAFITSFEYADEVSIQYTIRALEQLPYSALIDVTVSAKTPTTVQATASLGGPVSLSHVQRRVSEVTRFER